MHGHITRDISLEGQQQVGKVVYEQQEFVLLDDVIEKQFPVQFIIPQPNREKAGISQFFPIKFAQNIKNQSREAARNCKQEERCVDLPAYDMTLLFESELKNASSPEVRH